MTPLAGWKILPISLHPHTSVTQVVFCREAIPEPVALQPGSFSKTKSVSPYADCSDNAFATPHSQRTEFLVPARDKIGFENRRLQLFQLTENYRRGPTIA